jgi:hypothetical protein
MIRTNISDAFTTTCLILFVIALVDGKYATGFDWAIRTICVYPFTHLGWRVYRNWKR